MWLEIAYGTYIVGSLAYHRWKDAKAPLPSASDVLNVPRTEPGEFVPIVFGRTRVDKPVIAWSGNKTANLDIYDGTSFHYVGDVLYLIGIPFLDGTTRLQGIYIGGRRCENGGTPNDHASTVPGTGGFSVVGPYEGTPDDSPDFVRIGYEFGDGASTQDLGAGGGGNGTYDQMTAAGVPADQIPGFACIATFLARYDANASTIPGLGFEISTYPVNTLGRIGDDANPVSVIISILCDRFGKLGLEYTDVVDNASFIAAATKLKAENHGYSRTFDGGETGWEMIEDVLRQIDGVIYEEPTTGRLGLKLIRPDYDLPSTLLLTPSNCTVESYQSGWGPADVNKVAVKYRRRQNQYQTDVGTADNLANLSGQDGGLNEVALDFPGCTTPELAATIAARELGARTRPLATARVRASRQFWNTRPGDVVRLTCPDVYASNKVFRVADVDRGGPADNFVVLDLVEDFFFTHRGHVVDHGGVAPNPGPGILDPSA